MRFLFDNNLPPALARSLHILTQSQFPNHEVVALRDRFSADASDINWIGTLAEEGDWVIISLDRMILKNPHELSAWKESGLTAFFLKKAWSSLPFWEKSSKLVKWWPSIITQAESVEPGVGFLVPVSSSRLSIL